MKPLIISFFMALLVYSLFFDDQASDNASYRFGLEKQTRDYEPMNSMPQSTDSLAIYAGVPTDSVGRKNVI